MLRVVTMGGGHGQAALLTALCQLECEITAIVSVADDGGCSGELRRELGMPPPGDLRRCLTALARDRSLAERFEVRLAIGEQLERSAGNLALSEAFAETGSLQQAVDWAAEILCCRGRVVPVAETEGVLAVYDMARGAVEGETNVDKVAAMPMVAVVHGPEHSNPVATDAIGSADLILMGPGSFVTSTLATLTTAQIANAVARSSAQKVFLANIAEEGDAGRSLGLADQVRLLRDHLVIGSGEVVPFSVLGHVDADGVGDAFSMSELEDGTVQMRAPLASPAARVHDADRLSAALVHHLRLQRKARTSITPAPRPELEAAFEAHVERARQRLAR
jgi:uncharacterized cofD-like protein